ncbi:hypothetical protein [Paenibacillus bouchesdurhonensis]|uniref:hypothetical protein n=1 Tax=Paenibacillus bouchesdurhonensis TaxID=1870990 RepID=UPI000DA619B6|nr:hypothetical protein [Paenibacillus bouchesdurhonensis]
MSSRSRVIKDDEEYQRAEEGKFKLAAELDDPLSGMTEAERARKLAIYDRTVDLIEFYRRGRLVQEFPGLREQYRIWRKEFQEFDSPATDSKPPEAVPAAAAAPPLEKPEEPKQSAAAAWLDDD